MNTFLVYRIAAFHLGCHHARIVLILLPHPGAAIALGNRQMPVSESAIQRRNDATREEAASVPRVLILPLDWEMLVPSLMTL